MLQVGNMAPSTLNCTYNAAWGVAEDIKKYSSHVIDVIIFGSVARDLIGNDIDIVIIVDEVDFQKFVKTLGNGFIDSTDRRFDVAEIAQFDEGYATSFIRNKSLDVWLLPTDWKGRIDEIRALLPKHHDGLLLNIHNNFRQPLA